MRTAWVSLVAGIAIGIASTLAIGGTFHSPPPTPTDESSSQSSEAAAAGISPTDGADPTAIADQLERIRASIAALDAKVEEALRRPDRVPARDASATATVDEDSLVRAMRRVEEDRLASLSPDGLISEARALRAKNDLAGAQRALELLLGRDLEPLPRAHALTEFGMLLRTGGDLEASARNLEQAMNTVGFGCAEGAWAGYQLMWTRKEQGRQSDALVLADAIAGSTVSNSSVRMHGRWLAATLSHDFGNFARARADYAAILDECADAAEYRHIVADVRQRSSRLR